MKYRLLNYIICPKCKTFPLKLTILKRIEINRSADLPPCDLYCGYKEDYIEKIGEAPCKECIRYEVIDGYLTCTKCGDTYPIIDSITILQLKFLKPRKAINEFINKYKEKLPEEVYERWI